ncbi:MAG: fatty acid desaturase family protein, partial [Cyanobacteria bacterium REEB67]|nr:fatty acid desaturase family protein [Cyanobacteria bacterium REEB67]
MQELDSTLAAGSDGVERENGQDAAIAELYKLRSFQNVVFMLLEWLSIGLAVYLTQKFFNPFSYFLAVVWIGSRFQALGVLMHEAVHYRLFKNRTLNEIVGELLAWPLALTMKGYRNSHLAHHQNLNTAEDPDYNQWDKYYKFPKTKKQMLVALIENAVGIGFIYDITQTAFKHTEQFEVHNRIPATLRVCQISFYVAVIALSIAFSFWHLLLLYWLVPVLTATKFFDYLRAIGEHYGMESSNELNSTRNTFGWECFFIAPYSICVHLAHHLYPGVPWYNLHKLQA